MTTNKRYLLRAFGIFGLFFSITFYAPETQAANKKSWEIYGSYSAALVQTSDSEITLSEETLEAADADGVTIEGRESQGSFKFSSVTWGSNKFGFRFKVSDDIKGTVEVGVAPEEGNVSARKYHINVALGPGELIVGAQSRPYAEVAGSPDIFFIAHAGEEGIASIEADGREEALTYIYNFLENYTLKASFQKPLDPGAEADGKTATPALEFLVGGELKKGDWSFGGNWAFHREDLVFLTVDEDGEAVVDEEGGTEFSKEAAMTNVFNAWFSKGKYKGTVAYSRGDYIFGGNLQTPVPDATRGLEGSHTSLAASFSLEWSETLGGSAYYGTQSGNSGLEDATDESMRTFGFNGTYLWKGAKWIAEYTSSRKVYNSEITRSINSLGFGVSISWGA